MKKALKQKVLAERDQHPEEHRHSKSELIASHLYSLPEYDSAGTILFYVSIGSEVKTHDMIAHALRQGKRVCVPVTGKEAHEITPCELGSPGALSKGAFGIPEPIDRKPVALSEIDLVIVPGVAFDEAGNRLGYGMGYYDKLLSRVKAPAIALSFELQLLPSIPAESHDVRVSKIVTEKRVITAAGQKA
jgi:5-formyltetrahydrofolate cyclo-ligase